jgi:methylmalonyl-CoA/ethylmalonyl-CoA epimerase
VLRTEATTGKGVPELLEAIEAFRVHAEKEQTSRRRMRASFRLRELLAERFLQHVEQRALEAGAFEAYIDRIGSRELDPHTAVDEIMARATAARQEGQEARRQEGAEPPAPNGPATPTLDHIGIAVADVEKAIAFYRDALGLAIEAPEEVPTQRVRARFVPVGEAALELLEATADDSPIAKFLGKRGPGIHHITLRVPDIRAALAALKARGVRLVDEAPRPGAHGSLVAFIHPSAAEGVLVELKQDHA